MEDRQEPEDPRETEQWETQKKEKGREVDQQKEDRRETEEWEKQKKK
jgi:hypothetical protein